MRTVLFCPPQQGTLKPRYVVRVIPPAHTHGQEEVRLIAAMHSLVLDALSPVALELAGTPTERSFLVRTTTPEALAHAVAQLRGCYPQAEMQPLTIKDDPCLLRTGERVAVRELKAGAPSYLPFRSWHEEDGQPDPLRGVLGALDDLPEGTRVVSQIALIPAPIQWSRKDQRKALEHALDPEREARHQSRQTQALAHSSGETTAPPGWLLLLGGIFFCALLTYQHWQHLLPSALTSWLATMIQAVMHGQPMVASGFSASAGMGLFPLWSILGGMGMLLLGLELLRRKRLHAPLYDQALVGQQTSQMAYRVRFRLYVINDVDDWSHPIRTSVTTVVVKRCLQHIQAWRVRHHRNHILLARLMAAYRQYHLASGNYFVPHRRSGRYAASCLRRDQRLCWLQPGKPSWSRGLRSSHHLMSVETLTSLWHLPPAAVLVDLAALEQKQRRTLPIPQSLIAQAMQGTPIGIAEHAGHRQTVALPDEVLRTHLFVGGKSGEGKSTCLEYLACQAMKQGGLVVIDPHGDLVEHLLRQIPDERMGAVVLLDLSDEEHVLGLNPLDASQGRGRDKAVADVLKTLAHIWASSWGSRMENTFEYALRTLYEVNCQKVARGETDTQYTLLDVMVLLTDEQFCHALLQQVNDPFILRWWHLYYDPLNPQMQRERSDPVLSKVAKFESQIARRIVGQSCSTINFAECIQQGKIILMKLAKGVVGEDVARLLGATLLGLLQITLEEQGNLLETQRKPLGILIDEFQVLKGVDWGALAELRKYGAAFYLATQSLEYLEDMDAALLHTVLANVKQYLIFHMSAADAQSIHLELGVEVEDIVNLERYMCYVRLMTQQQRQPTFSMTLLPPAAGDAEKAEQIRRVSSQRYTVAAATVEERLRRAIVDALLLQPTVEAEDAASSRFKKRGNLEERQQVPLARQQHGYRGRKSEEQREKGNWKQKGENKPLHSSMSASSELCSEEPQKEKNKEEDDATS